MQQAIAVSRQPSAWAQTWSEVHPTAKTLIVVTGYLIGTGALVFAGYKTYKYFSDRAKAENARNEIKDVNKDIKDLQQSGMKGTLSPSQLSDMANQLETAFQGYTTDNDTVFRVMSKVRNDVDMLNLKKVFGVRTISSGKLNPAPDKIGTLGEIVSDEMSINEINAINGVLAKQGVRNRF